MTRYSGELGLRANKTLLDIMCIIGVMELATEVVLQELSQTVWAHLLTGLQ